MAQIIYILLSLLLLVAVLYLFLRKAGLQLQYLRLQKKKNKNAGKVSDYLRFNWSNEKERQERWQAFLMFPMLYAVQFDEEKEELLNIKKEIKRIHILIYLVLIALIIVGIYSEKVFA